MRSYLFQFLTVVLATCQISNSYAQCPITNACTPGNATNAQAVAFGGGIYQVSLGTFIQNSAGAAEGYKDNCELGTTDITIGSPLAITVRTGNLVSENVRVYIDLNNDLSFNPATELVFSSNNAKVHNGNINLSSGTQGQILKMRVTADLITAAALPGPCTTPEYSQVEDYAVRIVANTTPPVAQFSVSDTLTCSGTVTFSDLSINNPTSWLWNFGDNQTSSLQNPSHTYTTPGKFSVKLKVTSANGSDSITKVNLINFNDTVPVAASCTPITLNQCCGYGITRMVFNTIDNFSGVGSYENFTCTRRTTVLQGRTYNLNLTTNPNQNQDTRVWIDYNNNGQFEGSEMVFEKINVVDASGSILISNDPGIVKGVPLRMRIISEYAGGSFNSCLPLDKGQCEDYTVIVKENLSSPVAGFTVSSQDFCLPTFQFVSTSENLINSYHWFFGDGTDSLTDQTSLSHTYSGTGSYNVKLVVVGPFGSDSIEIIKAVSFFGAPAASCDLTSQVIPQPIQVGIARVQFGSIDKSSGIYSEGYQDFSCTNQASFLAGQTVQLKVKNSSQQNEKVRVWIDWNGNGAFETTELVLTNNNDTVHIAQVLIPETALFNQTLRMRVASNINQAGAINACGNIQAGQAEDYGVIVFPNTVPPTTLFSVDNVQNCTGVVKFIDQTTNAPTSHLWYFGDGQTSTDASPTHTYSAPGTYTIKLVTSNAFGMDSLIRPDYISVTQLTGMVPVSCTPAASTSCCQYGIQRFTFAGIDKQSGMATEGNMDFSCEVVGSATIATAIPISIQNSGTSLETVGVWIDWDNNGTFATSELVFTSTGTTNHIGTVTIPGNAQIGVGLRIRVRSDANNQPLAGACAALQFGQTEDYQIKLLGNNNPPIALFKADKTLSCFNTIQFTDTSYNAPSTWKWYFGDGDSSSLRNPEHTYPGPGTYTVTLIASNGNGTDTTEKIGYIQITDGENLKPAPCSPLTVNTGVTNPGAGIIQVQLNTINKISGQAAAESYQDNSCTDRTNLINGQAYTLTVRTNQAINESCRAWVDWNNDGVFTDPAERVLTSNNARTHTSSIAIPVGARMDTSLRLRIISDIVQGPGGNLQPCVSPNFGQIEDYSVKVIENTSPPVARLFAQNRFSCSGFVQFGDSSQFLPSSWNWNFGDGQTSTDQNPLHQYLSTGVYSVKLKVSNAFGVDSVERINYVNVTGLYGPKPASCTNRTVNSGPFGISRVRFSNLDKTSGLNIAEGGYLDHSCVDSALAVITAPGQTNTLIVNTSNAQNCRVYIDFNNNGNFETTEMILNTTNNNVHNAILTLVEAQCLGVAVRMRVISDNRVNNITGPCYNPLQGQVEDYMARLIWAVGNQPVLNPTAVQIFPNPSDGNFKVSLPENNNFKGWSIVDMHGRVLSSGKIEEANHLEIRHDKLSSGIYNLSLQSESGAIQRKIIVQK